MSKGTVLVSGASGFIALFVVDALLSKGYKVIGTVRSESKGDNIIKNFKNKYPQGELSYEIVEDVAADGAFDDLLKKNTDITFVMHTASPFSFGLDKGLEEGYLRPAVNGTTNMLKGIKLFAPQVKRVVVTSSFASIMDLTKDQATFIYTEKSWNPITLEEAKQNELNAYVASKAFAEKLSWDFLEKEKPNFTLTTVCPPYVLGPQLFEDSLANPKLNTSAEIVNSLLQSKPTDTEFPISGLGVDVRDVAKMHVAGIELESTKNERLFPISGGFCGDSVLILINKNFPELQGKIAAGNPEVAERTLASSPKYDISYTEKIANAKWIPMEQIIVDSVKQILDYKKK